MNPQADAHAIQALRAVKGNPINILVAISICTTELFTAAYLRSTLDWSQDRIETGLAALKPLGLIEQVDRYTWRLTPRGRVVALAARAFLSSVTPEKTESLPDTNQPALNLTPEKTESLSGEGPPRQLEPPKKDGITSTVKSDSGKNGVKALLTSPYIYIDVNNDASARGKMIEALEASGGYVQSLDKMAAQLLADHDTDWLSEVMGWIAYAVLKRGGDTLAGRGATIWPKLNRREHPDPKFIPPAELPFPERLAWSLRGGKPLPEPEPVPALELLPTSAVDEPEPAPVVPLTADEQLWARVLAQIVMEVPKSTFENYVRATRLLRVEADAYVIGAANTYAVAWLDNRLRAVVKRTLESLLKRPVEVAFEVAAEEAARHARDNPEAPTPARGRTRSRPKKNALHTDGSRVKGLEGKGKGEFTPDFSQAQGSAKT